MRTASLLLVFTLLVGGAGLGCANPSQPEEAEGEEGAPAEVQEGPAEPVEQRGNRSVAQRLEDASLETRVKIALAEERSLRAYRFNPEVQGGRVTLQGDVGTAQERRQAAKIVEGLEGVEALSNQVMVGGQQVAAASTGSPEASSQKETPEKKKPDASQEPLAQAETEEEPPPEKQTGEGAGESSSSTSTGGEENTGEQGSSSNTSSKEYYVVKSGDSLWSIAQANGISVSQLRQLNDLSSSSLHPGDRLRVK